MSTGAGWFVLLHVYLVPGRCATGESGKKSKEETQEASKGIAPYQCLPVHPLLLKNLTVFPQLQLLQDLFHILRTPAARCRPDPL